MAILSAGRHRLVLSTIVVHLALAATVAGWAIGEAEVKAALLYNFASFVEWPEPAATDQPLVIGVAGDDRVAAAVRALPALPDGRLIEVRRLDPGSGCERCAIVYLALNERALEAMLARLAHQPVLTVGEHDRFTRLGGMIRIFAEHERLRFEVHVANAAAARLRISSRVLRLARLVRESDAETP